MFEAIKKKYRIRKERKRNEKAMNKLGTYTFNYKESHEVNEIFDKLFEIPWVSVVFQDHYTVVTTVTDLVIHIWSANAYHAWASQGFIRRKDQDNTRAYRNSSDNIYSWHDVMPSPWRMYEMDKKLKEYLRIGGTSTINQIFDGNAVTNKSDNYIENITVDL